MSRSPVCWLSVTRLTAIEATHAARDGILLWQGGQTVRQPGLHVLNGRLRTVYVRRINPVERMLNCETSGFVQHSPAAADRKSRAGGTVVRVPYLHAVQIRRSVKCSPIVAWSLHSVHVLNWQLFWHDVFSLVRLFVVRFIV